ncbi:MAG TPA: SMP-30/gluconolactonase/LRE family protein [Ktedonobacterales bacterium]
MNNNKPTPPQPQPLCAAFAPLLPLLNADELGPEQAASLRDHLATCAWCRAQLAGYDVIDSAARRHYAGTLAATPLFQPQEIEKMLDEPTAPVYVPLPTHPGTPRPPRRRRLPAFSAVAAAVLVAALVGMFFARQNTPHLGGHITATAHLQGTIVEYSLNGIGKTPLSIIAGADGNLWFTDPGANAIERITPGGHVQAFAVPTANSGVYGIARAADGILWFTEQNAIRIGSVDTSGKITDYPGAARDQRPTDITVARDGTIWYSGLAITTGNNYADAIVPFVLNGQPKFVVMLPYLNSGGMLSITVGHDGNLWYAASKSTPNHIAYFDPVNFLNDPQKYGKDFGLPMPNSEPLSITTDPDGNLWFVERSTNRIGRITPTGAITEFPVPTHNAGLYSITAGPDGNLWFTERTAGKIGRIHP